MALARQLCAARRGDMARIYISSTYGDLKEHREKAYRVLRQLGHDAVAMEDYVATDQRPLAKCLADVAACDVYVGVFASPLRLCSRAGQSRRAFHH